MITVDEHRERILAAARLLEPVTAPVEAALGRVLREPVRSAVDLPLFDNSAMDGFAVHHADVATASPDSPVTLEVVADLPAGTSLNPSIDRGQAARIMTGAPFPTEADTVVPFEDTAGGLADSLERVTVVTAPRSLGMHIRPRGEECRAGDEILPAGLVLGGRQLASAAAAGVTDVVVSRVPRVAVISTGDELRPPGAPLEYGQIPESNSALLDGLCRENGAEVVLRTQVTDDGDGLRIALTEASALGADVVITSGGVSAGAYEVVRNVAPMQFEKVAMQPGKPQGFGDGEPLLFGLPGNPVSVAVSFEVFVRPALLAMQGATVLDRLILPMRVLEPWRTPTGRRQYRPVVVTREGVRPASSGGSHLAASLGRADAYAIVPTHVDAVAAGDLVDVMLIS
ncbi:molybdopterin molybdotransferase MoeA [Microbacterium horticulturae]|uniref:Molybdopterin molybdenumtransferase n=1 Tax=Microbacterium horticulturae TaxID=3028316 RepID=A0ABY8BZW3_9MICO|nr:gephyrin-like molybdotransferase Glp [Microbacterium sp. KACC 23027]WEG09734.1 molybdopterin molybdotransferase MoeA [Microbacterium sp. KACC 23027]